MKSIYIITLLFLSCALNACSSDINSNSSNAKTPALSLSGGYQKPGAAIEFSHNYSGETEVGVNHDFVVTLTPKIKGLLSANISSKSGILNGQLSDSSSSLDANQSIEIPVSVNIPTNGKFYVTINASLTANDQVQHRAFSIAISSPKSEMAPKSLKVAPTVMILPSTETVK